MEIFIAPSEKVFQLYEIINKGCTRNTNNRWLLSIFTNDQEKPTIACQFTV